MEKKTGQFEAPQRGSQEGEVQMRPCQSCARYKQQNALLRQQLRKIERYVVDICSSVTPITTFPSEQFQQETQSLLSNSQLPADCPNQSSTNLLSDISEMNLNRNKEESSVNWLNLTEIAKEGTVNPHFKLISETAKRFSFEIRKSKYIDNFVIHDRSVKMRTNAGDKFQIVSNDAISKMEAEIAGIKIVRSQKHVIYFGLIEGSRVKEKYSAKVRDGSTISYKIIGGKRQLLVREEAHESNVSRVEEGQSLYMLMDYRRGAVDWFIDGRLQLQTKVDFVSQGSKAENWYVFVTMETAGDQIQIY